jgi:AcrR family transcriptional regulator
MTDSPGRGRPYRSELRQEQAARTRLRVVQAAVRLFGRDGYRATTFTQLAKEAGVSVKTVQEHGPKADLLQAAVELASFGVEGETDFFATDLGRAVLQIRDPGELAVMVGEAMLAINTPSAGLWMTFVAAAQGDAELTVYHARMLALIRGQVQHVLDYVNDQGWLRRDVPFDDLVEAFCVVTCIETFVRFVHHDGKSPDQYKAFVARTIGESILASGTRPMP